MTGTRFPANAAVGVTLGIRANSALPNKDCLISQVFPSNPVTFRKKENVLWFEFINARIYVLIRFENFGFPDPPVLPINYRYQSRTYTLGSHLYKTQQENSWGSVATGSDALNES